MDIQRFRIARRLAERAGLRNQRTKDVWIASFLQWADFLWTARAGERLKSRARILRGCSQPAIRRLLEPMLSAPRPGGGAAMCRSVASRSCPRQESQALAIELADSGILLVEAESSERDRCRGRTHIEDPWIRSGAVGYRRDHVLPRRLPCAPGRCAARCGPKTPPIAASPPITMLNASNAGVDRLAQPWESGRDRGHRDLRVPGDPFLLAHQAGAEGCSI